MKLPLISINTINPRKAFCHLGMCLIMSSSMAAEPEVVARIGDTEVKTDELRASLGNIDPREQAVLAGDPARLSQAVRLFLVQRLVLKEALAKQWEKQAEVATQIQRARETAITESYLQAVSKPDANFPDETELKAAYEANKAALLVPKQFRLAQIFIALAKNADKAAVDKAQSKLEATRKGLKQPNADFAAIARAQSDDKASAERGGEIGWLTESQIQPEIRPHVVRLAKAAASEPVQLNDGWHILKALDVKEAYTPALDEARQPLTQQLRAERTKANSQAYLANLLQQNPVAINELALAKILSRGER